MKWQTKITKMSLKKFGYSGLREGQWDIASLLKMSAMLRFGTERMNIFGGYFGAEADNTYKTLDRGFSSATVTNYSDKRRLYGQTFGVNIGGEIGDGKGLYVTFGGDLISEYGEDEDRLKRSFAPYICLGFEGSLK